KVPGVNGRTAVIDPLFLLAERQAADSSRFPERRAAGDLSLRGVLPSDEVLRQVRVLQSLDVDAYVAAAIYPSEEPGRAGARSVIRRLPGEVLHDVDDGPLYAAEVRLDVEGQQRLVGVLAQERRRQNGVWMPEHHVHAVEIIREYARRSMPVV